jgi:hypothetical protein
LFNAFNLCELQQHWIENIQLPAKNINFSILTDPSEQSLKCLPENFKNKAYNKIQEHINFLKKYNDTDNLISQWNAAIDFMFSDDHSYLLTKFFKSNDARDDYRKQKFENYFPEYKTLRSYV